MLLVALTIFVSLSAISAADVNNDTVKVATFSNESVTIYGEPIYAQSLHDDYDDLSDIELIKKPSTTVDNLEDDVNNDTIKVATFRSINESNDSGAIYARPANILTYDYITYDAPYMRYGNTIYIDGASHNLIIENAPQNIDFSKLSGVTGTVSVPEGYMIVIDGNNLTLKHM